MGYILCAGPCARQFHLLGGVKRMLRKCFLIFYFSLATQGPEENLTEDPSKLFLYFFAFILGIEGLMLQSIQRKPKKEVGGHSELMQSSIVYLRCHLCCKHAQLLLSSISFCESPLHLPPQSTFFHLNLSCRLLDHHPLSCFPFYFSYLHFSFSVLFPLQIW